VEGDGKAIAGWTTMKIGGARQLTPAVFANEYQQAEMSRNFGEKKQDKASSKQFLLFHLIRENRADHGIRSKS
jgi:hypothetical protein